MCAQWVGPNVFTMHKIHHNRENGIEGVFVFFCKKIYKPFAKQQPNVKKTEVSIEKNPSNWAKHLK